MSFTVADIVADTREAIQDTLVPYRYSDEFIVRKVNQVLRRAAILRPDLFVVVQTITCAAGSMQAAPTDSIRFMDVLSNTTGGALKEVSQDVLDMMVPTWEGLTPGPSINWMRYPRDPNRFYVYPAATAVDTLTITYARCPSTLVLTDPVVMQDVYMPVILDGTVWLMESTDAEHVESGSAKMYQDSFVSGLTGGLSSRRITDTGTAGLPPEEVIQ
jgi:hypothetical protein